VNYAAHASVLFGKNAINPENIRTLVAEFDARTLVAEFGPEALEEEVAFSLKEGYVLLELFYPREGHVWDLARLLRGFAFEPGPDSGGPGYAGTADQQLPLYPHNLPRLHRLYEGWRRNAPPVDEKDFQLLMELLHKEVAR
jgi:hypothetical protein